jgi:uncharacterized membrane protein
MRQAQERLDLAIVTFRGESAAARTFGEMRAAAGEAAWIHEIALVEHLSSGRMVVRGTFAGRYVDVDESDRFSETGAAGGALTGALLGAAVGPAGFAAGLVLGAIVGAETATPTEAEPEPQPLRDQLRAAVAKGHSAIVLLAAPEHVDAMLAAVTDGQAQLTRYELTPEQTSMLKQALAATPEASA